MLETFNRRSDILFRRLDDEAILYDPETTTVHVLNPTSELIWSCCDGHHNADEIASEILKRYQAGKGQVAHDVEEALNRFKGLRLLMKS